VRPHLVVNPTSDDSFVNEAHLAVGGIETAAELEMELRQRYPRVVVHERTLDGERDLTWYVYRDGAWGVDLAARSRPLTAPQLPPDAPLDLEHEAVAVLRADVDRHDRAATSGPAHDRLRAPATSIGDGND
jgi:hypothetical protein